MLPLLRCAWAYFLEAFSVLVVLEHSCFAWLFCFDVLFGAFIGVLVSLRVQAPPEFQLVV